MRTFLLLSVICLSSILRAQTANRTYMFEIPQSGKNPVFFTAEECTQSYFKINLKNFDIGIDKKFLKKYKPLAYVQVDVSGKKYVKIVGNDQIEFSGDKKNLSIRSIENKSIVGFIPYTGGDVTVSVELYAIKTEDKFEESIKILSDITGLFTTQAVPYVEVSSVIYKSIDKLLSGSPKIASYQNTFNPYQGQTGYQLDNIFREGYFIIQNDPNFDVSKIDLSDSQVRYNNRPISDYKINYMLLYFDHEMELKNYMQFDFYQEYLRAIAAVVAKNEQMGLDIFEKDFMSALYGNRELTLFNKRKLELQLYLDLVSQIKLYHEDFAVKNFKDVCVNRDVKVLPSAMASAPQSEQELLQWREQQKKWENEQRFINLRKSVEIDKALIEKVEQGLILPHTPLDEKQILWK